VILFKNCFGARFVGGEKDKIIDPEKPERLRKRLEVLSCGITAALSVFLRKYIIVFGSRSMDIRNF
jgi:hypothetical protein